MIISLAEFRKCYKSFQPVIVAVVQIKKYFIALNDKLFEVSTSLDAVSLALRIFFTLDCEYPINSKTIGIFLQKILFDIDLASDNLPVDVNVILGHIRSTIL